MNTSNSQGRRWWCTSWPLIASRGSSWQGQRVNEHTLASLLELVLLLLLNGDLAVTERRAPETVTLCGVHSTPNLSLHSKYLWP